MSLSYTVNPCCLCSPPAQCSHTQLEDKVKQAAWTCPYPRQIYLILKQDVHDRKLIFTNNKLHYVSKGYMAVLFFLMS